MYSSIDKNENIDNYDDDQLMVMIIIVMYILTAKYFSNTMSYNVNIKITTNFKTLIERSIIHFNIKSMIYIGNSATSMN